MFEEFLQRSYYAFKRQYKMIYFVSTYMMAHILAQLHLIYIKIVQWGNVMSLPQKKKNRIYIRFPLICVTDNIICVSYLKCALLFSRKLCNILDLPAFSAR